jgi:glycine oxidase
MAPSISSCIVVGAGPIGLFSAYVLAQAGYEVALIDDGRRGAGWASGGMLGGVYETLDSQDFPDFAKHFALASQKLWQTFLNTTKAPQLEGSVFLARNKPEVERLSALSVLARQFEIDVVRCEVPAGAVGLSAWSCDRDCAIDPRHMLTLLRQACLKAGVTFIANTVAEVNDGKITLDDGQVLCAPKVIIATGHRGLVHSIPELAILSPVRGQMLAVAGAKRVPERVFRAGRIYLIPRGDRLVVGATSQDEVDDPTRLDLPLHRALFQEASALWPDLARGQIIESWAGLRPKTPDGLPLLGFSQNQGVIIATGAYRNGWLLAAGIANSVLELVRDGPAAAENLQPFTPNRFST